MQGFRVVSIYRPDTGAVVQLNSVIQEATSYTRESVGDGPLSPHLGRYEGGARHAFTCRFLGHAEGQQLMAWFEQGVPVQAVAIAAAQGGRNLQWYESVRLDACRPVDLGGFAKGRGDAYEVRMVADHPRAKVYSNTNLLAYIGWQDSNSDGVADGYNLAGAPTASWVSVGAAWGQKLTRVAADVRLGVNGSIPVAAGLPYVLGMDVSALSGSCQFFMDARTKAGSVLATVTGTLANGPCSLSITPPAGTYSLFVFLIGYLTAGTVTISNPALRTDGLSTYTPY